MAAGPPRLFGLSVPEDFCGRRGHVTGRRGPLASGAAVAGQRAVTARRLASCRDGTRPPIRRAGPGSLPSPSIVTVDVDYCSSTRATLEFLVPILKSGTVFYFDDLYAFHLHPEMGQLKAISEFNGELGYLSPLREFDYAGKTFMYATLDWEHGS